jgi:small subunit ribosomal protein S16
MAVRIRLRRIGKNPKKKPHFRITVFDERTTRDGRFIEELGFYNPISKMIKIDKAKFDAWVKKGAKATASVQNVIKKAEKLAKKEIKDAATSNAG